MRTRQMGNFSKLRMGKIHVSTSVEYRFQQNFCSFLLQTITVLIKCHQKKFSNSGL